jgi:hypothetical protein
MTTITTVPTNTDTALQEQETKVLKQNNKKTSIPWGTIFKYTVLNLDIVFLGSIPFIFGALGTGFAFLEEKNIAVISGLGLIGSRVSVVLGTTSSLPLIVFCATKNLLINVLNTVTFKKINPLRKLVVFTDWQMRITTLTLQAMPCIVYTIPKGTMAAMEGIKTIKGWINNFGNRFQKPNNGSENDQNKKPLDQLTLQTSENL